MHFKFEHRITISGADFALAKLPEDLSLSSNYLLAHIWGTAEDCAYLRIHETELQGALPAGIFLVFTAHVSEPCSPFRRMGIQVGEEGLPAHFFETHQPLPDNAFLVLSIARAVRSGPMLGRFTMGGKKNPG